MDRAEEARERLRSNISASNILAELKYFQRQEEKSFERTYGWAWLLKLAEEAEEFKPSQDEVLPIANYIETADGQTPLTMEQVIGRINANTKGWPCRIGTMLFEGVLV